MNHGKHSIMLPNIAYLRSVLILLNGREMKA